MKLILTKTGRKRPYTSSLRVRFVAALTLIIIVGANPLLWQSQISQVVLVLVSVTFHLIPPIIWFGSVLIVAIWLRLLMRLWQQ